MSDTTLGAVSPDEKMKRVQSAINAQLESIASRTEERILEAVAGMIGQAEQPVRTEFVNRSGESVIKQQVPWHRVYDQMPDEVRAIRNPDTDHWMREWWHGFVSNDRVVMSTAISKLDTLLPHLRAETLEGAASTTGGFAAGTGGTLLPRPLEALVAIARDRTAKMWRWATTYVMTAQEHNIPTGTAVTANMVTETSTGTSGEPTFSQVPLIAYSGLAKIVLGNDLIADQAVNLISFITTRGGAALGVLEDAEFFRLGSGSAPHVNRIGGTTTTFSATTVVNYTEVLKMYTSVQQEYRDNSRWFVASDVLAMLAGVRDGMGRPYFVSLMDPPTAISDTPSGAPAAGAVGTLLGKPVHDVPFSNGVIWFGDPAATYAIGRREGVTVESSKDFYFDTRRTMFLIRQRFAGNNVDTAAAQIHTGITSATSL